MEALIFFIIIIFAIGISNLNEHLKDREYQLAQKRKEERLAREQEEKKKWETYNKIRERQLRLKQEHNRRLSISTAQLKLEDSLVKSINKFILRDARLSHDYEFESIDLLTVQDKIAFLERCFRSCHTTTIERLNSKKQDTIIEAKKEDLQISQKSKIIHEEKAHQGLDILNKQEPERFSTCQYCNGEGCLKCDFRGYND